MPVHRFEEDYGFRRHRHTGEKVSVLKKLTQLGDNGSWFVGCTEWQFDRLRENTNRHRFVRLPQEINVDAITELQSPSEDLQCSP